MGTYSVHITETALEDMDQVYQYIAHALHAPENAAAQYDRIAEEILGLELFPLRYRPFSPEDRELGELRRMLVDSYSVFYVVRDSRVIVTDVLYSASDLARRLAERRG